MSDTPDEEGTATPPPAEPVEPTPAPAPATRGLLHNRPLQFTAVGLAGLLIGCAVGGGVVGLVSHHGDRYERHHDQRFDRHPGMGDQRDRGPFRRQRQLPPIMPQPGPTATVLPTPQPTS